MKLTIHDPHGQPETFEEHFFKVEAGILTVFRIIGAEGRYTFKQTRTERLYAPGFWSKVTVEHDEE